jgi:hypothetical protein
MAPASPYGAQRLTYQPSFVLFLLCLFCAACSTTDRNRTVLFEDLRGTVSLRTTSDQSIHATHPISLEPAVLAKVLKGIQVQEQERGIQRLLEGRPTPVPVFSDEQVQFLAPLLADGFRKAAPDQLVEYRVQTTRKGVFLESPTTETTAGSLYAYGRQLYVILSQYRYSPARAGRVMNDDGNRSPLHDTTNLLNHTLVFTPSEAQRSDAGDPPEGGKPTDKVLAIDYELLQQAPAATATQTAPQPERTAPTRDSPARAGASEAPSHSTEALAQEVEKLRKELQSVQKQLGNQKPQQQK